MNCRTRDGVTPRYEAACSVVIHGSALSGTMKLWRERRAPKSRRLENRCGQIVQRTRVQNYDYVLCYGELESVDIENMYRHCRENLT
jgi:hypothetical protein